MTATNVITLTCLHNRRATANIFIRKTLTKVYCVASNDSDYTYAKDYFHKAYQFPNNPLSAKWQYGVEQLRNEDFEAVIMMGADDIMNHKTLLAIQESLRNGAEFVAFDDIYIWDRIKNLAYYWGGYDNHRKGEPCGAGRVFTKELLERMDYQLWTGAHNLGLDGVLWNRLNEMDVNMKLLNCKRDGLFLCDIKDGEGITSVNHFRRHRADIRIIKENV